VSNDAKLPPPPAIPHDMAHMLRRITGTEHACPRLYDRELVEDLDGDTDIQEIE
jgi:hypothetical protein